MKKSKNATKRIKNRVRIELAFRTFGGYLCILVTLFLIAFLVRKTLQFAAILVSYTISRFVYPTTWHANTPRTCFYTTIATFITAFVVALPFDISFFTSVIVGNAISILLFIVELALDRIKQPLAEPLNIYALDEDSLRTYGRSVGLSENIVDTLVLRVFHNYKWVEIQQERNYTKQGIYYHKQQIERKTGRKL